jgi:hypothetical protein
VQCSPRTSGDRLVGERLRVDDLGVLAVSGRQPLIGQVEVDPVVSIVACPACACTAVFAGSDSASPFEKAGYRVVGRLLDRFALVGWAIAATVGVGVVSPELGGD